MSDITQLTNELQCLLQQIERLSPRWKSAATSTFRMLLKPNKVGHDVFDYKIILSPNMQTGAERELRYCFRLPYATVHGAIHTNRNTQMTVPGVSGTNLLTVRELPSGLLEVIVTPSTEPPKVFVSAAHGMGYSRSIWAHFSGTSLLNELTNEQTAHLLGSQGTKEIAKLAHLLSPESNADIRGSLGLSIVTRGEAALFGSSAPRFALRLHLDREGSFVNCRKFLHCSSVPQCRSENGNKGVQYPQSADTFEKGMVLWRTEAASEANMPLVADSMLKRPSSLGGCLILETDANALYRLSNSGKAVSLTPFIRYLGSSGGMCAQAACFMATMLRHESASAVHGLAEITALAAQRLPLSDPFGFEPSHIFCYLESVGLRGTLQVLGRDKPETSPASLHADFLKVATAYLRSHMPIIAPVCRETLARSITKRDQGRSDPEGSPSFNARDPNGSKHYVVIIGISEDKSEIIFNDPGGDPFVRLGVKEFADCLFSITATEASVGLAVIPVTPDAVRVSLLPGFEYNAEKRRYEKVAGLLSAASLSIPGYDEPSAMEETLLEPLGDLENAGASLFNARGDRGTEAFRNAKQKLRYLTGMADSHWVWMGRKEDQLYIWDAEDRSSSTCAVSERVPVATFRWQDDKVDELWWSAPPSRSVKANELCFVPAGSLVARGEGRTRPNRIQTSVITSFYTKDLGEALLHWPTRCRNAVAYTFCQADLVALCPEGDMRRSRWREVPWLLMSELCDNTAAIHTIAERMDNAFLSRDVRIVSLQTWCPEIMSPDEALVSRAQRALLFAVRLARSLQILGQPVRTIETVGGSVCAQSWATGSHEVSMGRNQDLKAIKLLVSRLRPIANELQLSNTHRICLALELEPGPLYVLGNPERLNVFLETLRMDPVLSPVVGLNLDLAHWVFLGGQTLEDVQGNEELCKRIIHAHISEHARGHFSDCVVGAIESRAECLTSWLALLADRGSAPADARYPTFSGHISIELEAASTWNAFKSHLGKAIELIEGAESEKSD